MKANSHPVVLNTLHSQGCRFESASTGEYYRLKEMGVSDNHIINGQVIKTDEQIRQYFDMGCRYFVCDDERELYKLQKIAPNSLYIIRLYVSDLYKNPIGYGMPVEEIIEKKILAQTHGISFHISVNNDICIFKKIMERVESILSRRLDPSTEWIVNIGGGWRNAPTAYYENLKIILEKYINQYNIRFFAEPGYSIVNSSGEYHTKVIMVKKKEEFYDVYIDGGLPDGAIREPVKIVINSDENDPDETPIIYRFKDATCDEKYLFIKRIRKQIHDNDLLTFCNYGAYSLVTKNDFHLWPYPNIHSV
jgi:diaminopimelate decarboxylase